MVDLEEGTRFVSNVIDCDPDEIDLPIPGNDDSIRSIDLVIRMLADAVVSGNSEAAAAQQEEAEGAAAEEPATVAEENVAS